MALVPLLLQGEGQLELSGEMGRLSALRELYIDSVDPDPNSSIEVSALPGCFAGPALTTVVFGPFVWLRMLPRALLADGRGRLRRLELRSCYTTERGSFGPDLSRLKALTYLHLGWGFAELPEPAVLHPALASATRLRALELSEIELEQADEGLFDPLFGLTGLTALKLKGHFLSRAEDLPPLPPQLHYLSLFHAPPSYIEELAPLCPRLHWLSLHIVYLPLVVDGGVAPLLTRLEALLLTGTPRTKGRYEPGSSSDAASPGEKLAALAQLPALAELAFNFGNGKGEGQRGQHGCEQRRGVACAGGGRRRAARAVRCAPWAAPGAARVRRGVAAGLPCLGPPAPPALPLVPARLGRLPALPKPLAGGVIHWES